MSDESEEIHSGGLLKRYVERPDCLKNITLADWAAWCDSCGKQKNSKVYDDELLNGDETSLTSDPSIKSIRKRTQLS